MLEPYDEAHAGGVAPLAHYADVLAELAATDLRALRRELDADAAARGLYFGSAARPAPFAVDPVPRILTAAEWETIAAGVAQRVRALDAWVADAQGRREAVAAGIVPGGLLEGSVHDEPDTRGLPPAPVRIGVAGLDLVRTPDGGFVVLEDNVRTPSGPAVVVADRAVVRGRVTTGPAPRPLDGLIPALGRSLRAAAGDAEDPCVVLLHDGPTSSAGSDVALLSAALGIPAVELDDLRHAGDRLVLRAGGRPIDVVYRRTSEERLRGADGRLNALGEAFAGPLRAGTVRVVNAFGCGVADDKRIYAHVEDLVRFFCGEEPVLRSVRTHDPRAPETLERLGELVAKPRAGSGGWGVVVGPQASAAQLDAARRALARDPDGWVVQDLVVLSTHPTAIGGRLEPRHVDLRPFALFDGERVEVPPGGLSRYPRAAGELVVNSGQGGGAKDTWVLDPPLSPPPPRSVP